MLLPPMSDMALKEWAVAVRVMARGDQIITLRKGGIHRDDREFRVVHDEFLLFPTYEHQRPELLKEQYQKDLAETLEEDDVPGLVSMDYWCRVTDKYELRDPELLERLSPYHAWSDGYAEKRLHWRPKQPLTIALLRLYRLQQPQALPVLDEFEGCKSWVPLGQDVPLGYMDPVLADDEYERRADAIRGVLDGMLSAV
jgi:hypothetical protein